MILFSLLVLGGALYLYSMVCFDAPISPRIRTLLTVCRFLFLIAILYLLMKPEIQETDTDYIRPTLYLALDDSKSMSYPVYPERVEDDTNPSRWRVIQSTLADEGVIERWRKKKFVLRFGLLSELSQNRNGNGWKTAAPLSVQPNGSSTDLSAAVNAFQHSVQPEESSYLLLFTDGQWNEGNDPLASVQNLYSGGEGGNTIDRRVFTFGVGTTNEVFDLAIDSFQMPSTIRSGDAAEAEIHVTLRGDRSIADQMVGLRGRKADGSEIFFEEKQVSFLDHKKQTVTFELPFLPKGEYEFVAEINEVSGEAFTENNRANRGIRVRETRDPILLLTTAPSWDFKFLKRILASHQAFEPYPYLLHENGLAYLGSREWMLKRNGNEAETEEPRIPIYKTVEDLQANLSQWSAIVLCDVFFQSNQQPLAAAIRDYVQQGGGVVRIPGLLNCSPYPDVIQNSLPPALGQTFAHVPQSVIVMNDSPLLSEITEDAPQNLPPLSPLYVTVQKNQASLNGVVLMNGTTSSQQTMPLVEWYRYGLGRIVVAYTNSFWRWDMLTGKSVLPTFWLSMIYHAKPDVLSTAGELMTDGFVYEIGQPMQFRYTMRERITDATVSGIPVQVQSPDRTDRIWLGQDLQNPGTYNGQYTPITPGNFSASAEGRNASAAFRVEARFEEMNNLQQNLGLLREIATLSGGQYANSPAWKELADNIPMSTQTLDSTHLRFLGEKWWMVTLLILFLTAEWFIRWRQGLP